MNASFTLFNSPFPEHVAFKCVGTTVGHNRPSLEEVELNSLSPNATEKRKLEFTAGRCAARLALQQLGLPAGPIPVGSNREPVWPEGAIGSITHTAELAAAACGRCKDVFAIGIDLERTDKNLKYDISAKIADPEEFDWIDAEEAEYSKRLITLFSAKESIYKALYPHCRKYFGFLDVRLKYDQKDSYFSGTLLKALSPRLPAGYELKVGCSFSGSLVLTHILI